MNCKLLLTCLYRNFERTFLSGLILKWLNLAIHNNILMPSLACPKIFALEKRDTISFEFKSYHTKHCIYSLQYFNFKPVFSNVRIG